MPTGWGIFVAQLDGTDCIVRRKFGPKKARHVEEPPPPPRAPLMNQRQVRAAAISPEDRRKEELADAASRLDRAQAVHIGRQVLAAQAEHEGRVEAGEQLQPFDAKAVAGALWLTYFKNSTKNRPQLRIQEPGFVRYLSCERLVVGAVRRKIGLRAAKAKHTKAEEDAES